MQVSQPQPTSLKLIYPPTSLQQTTIENAKRIHHLEHLIRAERQELDRLLIQNSSPSSKRTRHSTSDSSSSPQSPATPPPLSSRHSLSPNIDISSPAVPTTPPALSQSTPHSSPKGIMYPYQTSYASPQPSDRKPPAREMAARGSHWSFVEKARFEASLHKYGPFAWDQIIRTVGTRSEKQVKAYAARYRRRKKLAAKAQLEAAERLPLQNPTPLPPSLQATPTLQLPPTPPSSTEEQQSGSSEKTALLQPLQVDGLLTSEEDAVNDATFCDDVFGGNSLFDTPLVDSAVELPDVNEHSDPSAVELLVDRALQGDFVMDDKTEQEREVGVEGTYATEFLTGVFTH